MQSEIAYIVSCQVTCSNNNNNARGINKLIDNAAYESWGTVNLN